MVYLEKNVRMFSIPYMANVVRFGTQVIWMQFLMNLCKNYFRNFVNRKYIRCT
jgi:hypothetical protein